MGLGAGSTVTGKCCNLYPYLCLQTAFPILKGTVMQIEKTLTCFKSILKTSHFNYLYFRSNLSIKFAIFLKSSLTFNSFYCLHGSITEKREQLLMQNFSVCYFCLSDHICYHIICMTVQNCYLHYNINILSWKLAV